VKVQTTRPFDEDFKALPEEIKKRADKQLALLLENPRHPSLRTKRIKGVKDIWEGRITRDYCFTFQVIGDTYILRRIGRHEETLRKA
jgi:mRNA-degrading endonuclease YafQ of YafQ-DinJ toxin-antitoxin module